MSATRANLLSNVIVRHEGRVVCYRCRERVAKCDLWWADIAGRLYGICATCWSAGKSHAECAR